MVLGVSGSRRELAGLWIEYVLLPELLDKHLLALASGALSSPSHSELINMFLEQAVSSFKLSRKEPDPAAPTSSRKASSGKTATVLCERAVRVTVSAQWRLEDVEGQVARQVQSLLLKALIKYDKERSLVHECNYHRWVIRKALAPGNLGHAGGAQRSSTGDDTSEILQDTVDGLDSQEETSVAFLETVISKLPNDQQTTLNGDGKRNGQINCNEDYLCQLMFDLAEAHFMKGRMRRANELFTRCSQLVTGIAPLVPVPQDRLNGFVAACRAFDTSDAASDVSGQEVVLACEKRRLSIKRKHSYDHCNGVCSDEGRKPEKKFLMQNGTGQDQAKLLNGEVKSTKSSLAVEKGLVEVFAGDVLKRHLSWGYCLSLARDKAIPQAIRCKLAACNALRHVMGGAPFPSISEIIEEHERKQTVEYLLQLMGKLVVAEQVDTEQVLRLRQFCIYICCMMVDSWCWDLAIEKGLLSGEEVSRIREPGLEARTRTVVNSDGTILDVVEADSVSSPESIMAATRGQPPANVARILRARAVDALEDAKGVKFAKDLLSLAKRIAPEDVDTELFQWFLERTSLPEKCDPTPGMLEYVVVKLVDMEDWSSLRELSQWCEHEQVLDKEELALVIKEAGLLSELLPLCLEFQESIGKATYSSDDFSRLKAALVRIFEDIMGLILRTKEKGNLPQYQLGLGWLPIIFRISNPETLELLASLVAGWLQRSREDSTPLELVRYGALAEVTSEGALQTNSKLWTLKTSAECGKSFFRLLIERLLALSKSTQGDHGRGSKCLLGLADLAFVDEAYLKALQLYLQAGALSSSFYSDRMSSMAREFFTPWVITRMVTACQEIGARLQAVVLCQCLPEPDYESAFRILNENPLIVDRDAESYFECVWEIPILELLVNMHAKAGDRMRVNRLISLLQQPALNVHNPAAIRRAHILAMEQRFLQRFYAELVV